MSSQFAGFTQASPLDDDSMSVIGFANRPDLDRVLGSTSFTLDVVTGQIVESDIFLNSDSRGRSRPAASPARYDVESIALHEIGHLHGLGHSALGETQLMGGNRLVLAAEAVMFPVAFSAGSVNERTLRADDIAGIVGPVRQRHVPSQPPAASADASPRTAPGSSAPTSIAFSPSTGKLVGGFTLDDDGSFVIAGLDPGPQVVRVEPLDDADIDSFFDSTAGVDSISSRPSPRVWSWCREGGTANNVEVKVVAK